jgi:low temperature requirement protein LtrA
MATDEAAHEALHSSRLAVMRQHEQVTPLELFFDLVFVLAITQCTQLMSANPTLTGLARGLLVLALLWWGWVGYAWLTSVVDPEEGAVRGAIFAAMAAFLVVALCIPEAFGNRALAFALAYGVVRLAHIGLFMLASREEDGLRHSVLGLGMSTATAVAVLTAGALAGQPEQTWIWLGALALDMASPYIFGAEGWKLMPAHFAERHGLIVIIALGESIVAIGIGVGHHVSTLQGIAAVLGVALAAGMWWLYFDVVALVAARRLGRAHPGRHQNELARDSYSFLHFPMVAGIGLVALGLKKTLGDVDGQLPAVPAAALYGGLATYLLAHVAFRYRGIRTVNWRRTTLAVVLIALIPVAEEMTALAAVVVMTVLVWLLIAYETWSYGEQRHEVRHGDYAPVEAPR